MSTCYLYKYLFSFGLLVIIFLTSIDNSYAQDGNPYLMKNEILRLSIQDTLPGTARMRALSGAGVALGGDIAATILNPAGLGMLRSFAFTFTPSIGFLTHRSNYNNSGTKHFEISPSFGQIGATFSSLQAYNTSSYGFLGGAWGINLTEVNNFNSDYTYRGTNNLNHSYIDYLRALAYSKTQTAIKNDKTRSEDGMAYNIYLIDPKFVQEGNRWVQSREYNSSITGFPTQQERVRTFGYNYRLDLSYGANFSNEFMLGVSLGINSLQYREERTLEEYDFYENKNVLDSNGNPQKNADGTNVTERVKNPNINNINKYAETTVVGTGLSLTVGFIYIPSPFVRLGVKVKLPGFIFNDRESYTNLNVDYGFYNRSGIPDGIEQDSNGNDFVKTKSLALAKEFTNGDLYISKYTLITPMVASVGASFFFGEYGFLTTEVEYIGYRLSSISSRDFDPSAGNKLVKDTVRPVLNYKVGLELRVDPFSVRGGSNIIQNPLDDYGGDNYIIGYTAGIGTIINDWWGVDLTATHNVIPHSNSPYYFPSNDFTSNPDNNTSTDDAYVNSSATTNTTQLLFSVTVTYRL